MRVCAFALVALAAPVAAQPKPPPLGSCTAELDARKVSYKRTARPGIATAVEITGPLGGVTFEGGPLVMDCSLAVSLDEAGHYLRALGLTKATFSGAYSRRNVRDTNIPSKHSYGLAIDVHAFGALRIDRDFEPGLGDDVDCVGHPATPAGSTLKILQCQLVRSGLFHLVLTPDYDGDHHDHFHLEVSPWDARTALRSPAPAIH
jgi:hypothetical protein